MADRKDFDEFVVALVAVVAHGLPADPRLGARRGLAEDSAREVVVRVGQAGRGPGALRAQGAREHLRLLVATPLARRDADRAAARVAQARPHPPGRRQGRALAGAGTTATTAQSAEDKSARQRRQGHKSSKIKSAKDRRAEDTGSAGRGHPWAATNRPARPKVGLAAWFLLTHRHKWGGARLM
jgi:hypothetical protein